MTISKNFIDTITEAINRAELPGSCDYVDGNRPVCVVAQFYCLSGGDPQSMVAWQGDSLEISPDSPMRDDPIITDLSNDEFDTLVALQKQWDRGSDDVDAARIELHHLLRKRIDDYMARPIEYQIREILPQQIRLGYHGENIDFDWRPYEDRSPEARHDYDRLIVSMFHYGILKPIIVVQPDPLIYVYNCIIGMRRVEIAMRLNLERIPAVVVNGEDVRHWWKYDVQRLDKLKEELGLTANEHQQHTAANLLPEITYGVESAIKIINDAIMHGMPVTKTVKETRDILATFLRSTPKSS